MTFVHMRWKWRRQASCQFLLQADKPRSNRESRKSKKSAFWQLFFDALNSSPPSASALSSSCEPVMEDWPALFAGGAWRGTLALAFAYPPRALGLNFRALQTHTDTEDSAFEAALQIDQRQRFVRGINMRKTYLVKALDLVLVLVKAGLVSKWQKN